MLTETNDRVPASEIYDGDVIAHPVTGATVTVWVAMILEPRILFLLPGIATFDPLDNGSEPIDESGAPYEDGSAEEVEVEPEATITRIMHCSA